MPAKDPFAALPNAPAPSGKGGDPFASMPEAPEVQVNEGPANSSLSPKARTFGNYAQEGFNGIGRGIKDDVMGVYSTVRHPYNTAVTLYQGSGDALDAAQQEYQENAAAPFRQRLAATVLKGLEENPLTGGMVKRAEQGGDRYATPEEFGAAMEAGTSIAAPELLGKGLGAAGKSKYVTEKLPHEMINSLIKPMAADVRFGKNPAQAILEEGITGNNFRELGDKTFAKMKEVGSDLDKEAVKPANAKKRIDVSHSMDELDEDIRQSAKNGDQVTFQRLLGLKNQLEFEWKPFRNAQGEISLRPSRKLNLQSMSPAEALEFKRKIGDTIQWTDDPLQGKVNKAAGSAYGAVDASIDRAVPEIKDLNERYSNLVGAAKAIQRRTPVAERNAQWSLSDIALGATGHAPLAVARKVLSTVPVRTRVAKALYNMGDQTGPRQPMVAKRSPATTLMPGGSPGASVDDIPGPLQRAAAGVRIVQGKPTNTYGTAQGDIATVDADSPDTIVIRDPSRMQPQVLAHELTHIEQRNLAPDVRAQFPADNPQKPYMTVQDLYNLPLARKLGRTMKNMPEEYQAQIMQAATQYKHDPQMSAILQPWVDEFNAFRKSNILPTPEGAPGITTTPRAPVPPANAFAR